MTRYSPFNCPKKLVRRYGLGQKILRTRLDGPHRDRNIGMTGEKHDGQGRSELAEAIMAVLVRSIPACAHRGGCSPVHFRSASDPANAGPTDRSRPRNRPSSNDVQSPFGTQHRHRLHAQAPARVSSKALLSSHCRFVSIPYLSRNRRYSSLFGSRYFVTKSPADCCALSGELLLVYPDERHRRTGPVGPVRANSGHWNFSHPKSGCRAVG